jgi:hypothetical protein
VLVVVTFESLFGNTRRVAEAVADGLSGPGAPRVVLGEASTIDPERAGRAALLVLGGPTHYHGMATPSSIVAARQLQRRLALTGHAEPRGAEHRPEARRGRAIVSTPVTGVPMLALNGLTPPRGDVDLRAWIACLPRSRPSRAAAAFDTRVPVRWAGGASYAIARRLRRLGYHLVVPAQGFVVDGLLGPLRTGEVERARAWGGRLRRQLTL